MKFLKLFKKKRRSSSPDSEFSSSGHDDRKVKAKQQVAYGRYGGMQPAVMRRDPTQNVPAAVLTRIFTYVCPHSMDDSYEKSEESMTEDGCMLCDMRDLACCALVSRKWYWAARGLL